MVSNDITSKILQYIKFMKAHYKKKDSNEEITHTLLGPLAEGFNGCEGRGAFHITGLDYDVFLKLYKEIYQDINLHIVERLDKKVGPLLIDIDLHFVKKHSDRQYLDENIEYLVKKFNNALKKYLDIDKEDIKAYVSEKSEPTYDDKRSIYKDGWHIVYPDIPMDTTTRSFIFDKVKQEVIDEDGFKDIPYINDYKEIFDGSVLSSNGFLMYGSSKEGREPYDVTKIYNYDMTIDSLDNYDGNDMIDNLSIRRHSEDEKIEFKDKYINDQEFMNEVNSVSKSYDKDKRETQRDKLEKIEKIRTTINTFDPTAYANDRDIEFAIKLLDIINVKRLESYQEWRDIGWTCRAISPKLYDAFNNFSKKNPDNYSESGLITLWNSYDPLVSSHTISSLQWWAKQDNILEYKRIIRERTNTLFLKAESGTHDDIANVIKEYYDNTFKCVNITKGIWLEFQGNRWVEIDSGYTLSEKIAREIASEFLILRKLNDDNAIKADIEGGGSAIEKNVTFGNKLLKIYESLKNRKFNTDIVKTCAHKFYDKEFLEKLDTNIDLIGFNNGVYDLKNNFFRRAVPDDLISKTVGYNYTEFTEDDEVIKKIMKYFTEVQPKKEIREYLLRLLSSFLDGYVREQQFNIWTGSGCHGKGTEIKLYDNTTKKVEDIVLGDVLLGDDGRKRRVVKTFYGVAKLYTVTIDDEEKTTFRLSPKHRLALKCNYKPIIKEIYNNYSEKNIYWVEYHKKQDNLPTLCTDKFENKEDALKFLDNLKNNKDYIDFGDVIPITCDDWHYIKNFKKFSDSEKDSDIDPEFNEYNFESTIYQYYKLFKYNDEKLYSFELKENTTIDEYFGFELDGNKRYVMGNNVVTYNSNGKSTTVNLIKYTFGEYYDIMPIEALTHKSEKPGAATPYLADKKAVRSVFFEEPEGNDQIYVGKMKSLTGGSDITTRQMYGMQIKFRPHFKMVLNCNKLPHIPSNDGGTWRRLRVLQWLSKFVLNPSKSNKNEYKLDKELDNSMKSWGPRFIWLLIHKYYQNYRKEGLCEPPEVYEATRKYNIDTDFYLEFVSDFILTDEKSNEELDFVYKRFTEWYRSNLPGRTPPRKELQSYLEEKRKLVIENGIIHGVKFNNSYGRIQNGDSDDDTSSVLMQKKNEIKKQEKKSDSSSDSSSDDGKKTKSISSTSSKEKKKKNKSVSSSEDESDSDNESKSSNIKKYSNLKNSPSKIKFDDKNSDSDDPDTDSSVASFKSSSSENNKKKSKSKTKYDSDSDDSDSSDDD